MWTLALVDVDRAELRSRGRVADRKVLQSSAVTNVQPLYLQGWSARSSSTTSANMESGNIFQGNPPWSSYRLPGALGRRRRLAVCHAEQDI